MVRSNTGHERYIDLFLKNLPLTPSTAYRLSFDVLGAPLNLWFNDRHVETVEGDRCTPFCCKWTQHTVCFTTNAANRSSLPHYCFSFNKQLEGFPVTGRQDSYIDNVFLARQDEPEINLIRGGDFEAPALSSIYYTNWWPIWLDGHHSFYGMDIVPDPLNPANRCLKLPRLCQPPTYPADVSVRADSFGNYRDLKHRSYIFEPDGTAEHQLIFVNCGEVSGEAGDSAFSAPANSMIYLPPHTPTQYTFQKGDGQNYYWISFSGETANQLLSTAGLTTFTVVPANTPTLTAHIDHLLALPRTGAFYPYEVSSHLQLLLADVYRAICREKQQRTPPCIEEAALLLQNLGQVPPSNEQLARSCGMSTRHFLRLFKQYKGLSPQHYRTQKLMKQAAAILTTTEMTVTEITYALGMNDPYYFSRLFRAFHGLSPREYRKKHQHR